MSVDKATQRPERIRREAAAAILGVPGRTVTLLARRGEIPSAALIGRLWTFNEERLRAWIKAKEDNATMAPLTVARYAAVDRQQAQRDREAAQRQGSARAYEEAMKELLRGTRNKP